LRIATRANIKGWKIDLKAFYVRLWKKREKFHLSEDLWETPDGSRAIDSG
jgi:hypothetical protein